MKNFVLTFLVGALVVFGGFGVANALTFKSDGSVVKTSASKNIDFSKYSEFRSLSLIIGKEEVESFAAFNQGKALIGFKANGVLFYKNEPCTWVSRIFNSKTRTGTFNSSCPSGETVTGNYTFNGNYSGSSGSGKSSKGRDVFYNLGGRGSSSRDEIESYYSHLVKGDQKSEDGSYNQIIVASGVASGKKGGLYANRTDSDVCQNTIISNLAKVEATRRGLSCGVQDNKAFTPIIVTSGVASGKKGGLFPNRTDSDVCQTATKSNLAKFEAIRRGLSCGVQESVSTQVASATTTSPVVSSAALTAAQRESEKLRQEIATLKAQQKQQQQTISSDTQIPLITVTHSGADGRKGIVKGFAQDNVQVAEVLINGEAVNVAKDGSFEWSGFVPASGKDINIEAIDTAALSSTQVIRLERGQIQQASGPRFDDLDPTSGKRVVQNNNALALIVGVADYKRTDAPAIYADKDAEYFHDYASLKLGIPDSNITTMINDKAEQGDVILAVKDWMRRSSKPGETDIYVFFAGHGLASQDGAQMYLLPFDGRPRLLDKTAILREELFDDIASANPRSVTVFLDTCYSGTTRGTDMLIASRPIALKALKQSLPDNFTVLTAAAGDQTAKPLEEAKHGLFSYFLMKGMEGEADANNDNEITAGELHAYVQENVIQQSSGSQTPELQGDADRVLVQFQ